MKTTLPMTVALTVLMGVPLVQADNFPGFSMDFVDISDAGNAADNTGFGAVGYNYRMGVHEVSRGMITAYNTNSGGPVLTLNDMTAYGGNGANRPAVGISWNEAARFVNWLNTSQGYQAAYKFTTNGYNDDIVLWGSGEAWQAGGENLYRHKDAHYFLPSEDEWYKAAYYDPNANGGTGGYWDYAHGSDTAPDGLDSSGDTTFEVVYNDGYNQDRPNDITNAGVLSPYGTMAQNGNVSEWGESAADGTNDLVWEARFIRGGLYYNNFFQLQSSENGGTIPGVEFADRTRGFRVASVPEPSTAVLLALGTTGLIARRKRSEGCAC